GQAEFDEIRNVLRQERFLLPPRDDRTVYEEFAALFLELKYFASPLLPSVFPSIDNPDAIDSILAEDLDAAAILAATRPAGAPGPTCRIENSDDLSTAPIAETMTATPDQCRRLLARADRATRRGNSVRAASLAMRAGDRPRATKELARLTRRLQTALGPDEPADIWLDALGPLLAGATEGEWPPEARLLYDLQTVCVAYERPASDLDFVGWLTD